MKPKTTRKAIYRSFVFCAMLVGAGACGANIIYNVNEIIGGGSVTGTIETDGTTGVLAAADIVGWNLHLTGLHGSVFDLTTANSANVVSGSDLSATPTGLFFDFAAANDGYFLFQANVPGLGSGAHYFCTAATLQNFWCLGGGETTDPQSVFDNPQTYQFSSRTNESNPVMIGAAPSGPPSVPEPGILSLVGLALAGAALGKRR